MHVCKCRKSAPLGGGEICAHVAHGSDSLDKVQAIRYAIPNWCADSDPLENRGVETNNERRLRKLRVLCALHGIDKVAPLAGLKPVYLKQLLGGVKLPPKRGDGSRSERGLGDTAARAIEEAYKLGRGWFDHDGEEEIMSPKELELLGLFRQLQDEVLQGLVVENVRDRVEERARMLERVRSKAPTTGDAISGFGDLAVKVEKTARRESKP